jgi:ABC-type transporter Mla subunit MlaD
LLLGVLDMAKHRLTWRRVLPGLIIIGALLALAMMVLIRARVGALRGETYRLYLPANEARQVIKGTEVWLDGKKVGLVSGIRFRSPETDTSARLLLSLQILEDRQPLIRANSTVTIRGAGRLISSPVIYITSGTEDAPMLAHRDTLPPARQSDMETLASEMTLVARDFKPIVTDLRTLGGRFRESRERLGMGDGDRQELAIAAVQRQVQRFSARATDGGGTLGALARDDSLLMHRASRAMARVDSVLETAGRKDGSLARFGGDSALARNLASMRDELSIIRARMESASGSLGRFARDSALTWQMRRREKAMADLIEDIKRDPARYIAF